MDGPTLSKRQLFGPAGATLARAVASDRAGLSSAFRGQGRQIGADETRYMCPSVRMPAGL